VQELGVALTATLAAGVPFVEQTAIPTQRLRIEKRFSVGFNWFAVITMIRCVSKKSFDLLLSTFFVASATSDVGQPYISIQIDRLFLAARFGYMKNQ
jgi:hypothetical protein